MKSGLQSGRVRAAGLFLAGLILGVSMSGMPAGAHVGGSVGHLVRHLKKTFYTKKKTNVLFDRPFIKPGETVRGTIGQAIPGGAAGELGLNAQLPREAPAGLDDLHVVVDNVDEPQGACPGSHENPAAAEGYVCMYPYSSSGNVIANGGDIWGVGTNETRWGFQVSLSVNNTSAAYWFANWAYTAPRILVGRQ